MSLVGKIFSVLALILAVFYVGVTMALVSLQENYRQQMVDQKAQADRELEIERQNLRVLNKRYLNLLAQHESLQKERGNLEAANKELRSEWAEALEVNRFQANIIRDQETEIGRLNTQVENYRAENLEGRGVIDDLNAKIANLNQEKTLVMQARDEFADRLTKAEKDLTNALTELERVTEDNERYVSLLTMLNDQRPDIYAELITQQPLEPKKAIRGKVTAVDKGLGLVIMNVGQRHDVRKGYNFIVFRGPRYIGKIRVDEVFPDNSAAQYIAESMAEDVEVGDDVTTKLVVDF